MTLSVSAAKPMTSCGRRAPFERVARMSGFAVNATEGGGAPAVFLILPLAAVSGRQSATAAAQTATSTGRTDSQAASISRAVSTLISFTRDGGAMETGPETRIVSA